MTEPIIQNYGEQIEKEIQDFAKEVAEKKTSPEFGHLNEKEIVRGSIYDKIYGQPAAPAAAAAPAKAAPPPGDDDLLPAYLKTSTPEAKAKVEELINFTFQSGINKGIEEAAKSGAFVLDAYHDALTAKLHEELVKRGII